MSDSSVFTAVSRLKLNTKPPQAGSILQHSFVAINGQGANYTEVFRKSTLNFKAR